MSDTENVPRIDADKLVVGQCPYLQEALRNQDAYHYGERREKSGAVPKPDNVWKRLATLAGAIYADEKNRHDADRFAGVPADTFRTYIFEDAGGRLLPYVTPSGVLAENHITCPFDTVESALLDPMLGVPANTVVVGYDIETQAYPKELVIHDGKPTTVQKPPHVVSHQWYFIIDGVRFGLIFLTTESISQKQFLKIIAAAIPTERRFKKVYVYAYFSVMESGWMRKSYVESKVLSGLKVVPVAKPMVKELNGEWIGKADLKTFPYTTARGLAKKHTIRAEFCDGVNLQTGGVAGVGAVLGIRKRKLPDGEIERMASFLVENPRLFCDYAIVDSVIVAESHLFYHNHQKRLSAKMQLPQKVIDKTPQKTRMPSQSAAYFQSLFKLQYGKQWKNRFGYENGAMTIACHSFIRFYFGARNEALQVGPREEAHYLDMHSAYLTAVAMLPDYNFGHSWTEDGDEAEAVAMKMLADGPFQVAGVEISWRFKDGVVPIFPIRIMEDDSVPGVHRKISADGLIFPKNGHGNVMFSEFWLAMERGLLDKWIIHRVTGFQKENTQWFGDQIIALLKERALSDGNEKLYIKQLLNFLYGKFGTGVAGAAAVIKAHDMSRKFRTSGMSCYPLAAYITAFCRTVVGELIQDNTAYATITDAVITPTSREKLIIRPGGICDRVQQRYDAAEILELKNGKLVRKTFIGAEASGNLSLFLKTRAYAIIDTTKEPPLQKMAAMGAQVGRNSADPIKDWLEMLQRGYCDKHYFQKLNETRKLQKYDATAVPERKLREDVRLRMTFDMKHVPVGPEIKPLTWQGKEYDFVSFKTRPLETSMDFHVLRSLIYRDHQKDIPDALKDPELLQQTYPIDCYNSKPLDNPVSMEFENALHWEVDCIGSHLRKLGIFLDRYEPVSLECENAIEYDDDALKQFGADFKKRYEAHFHGRFEPKFEPIPTEGCISFNIDKDADTVIALLKRMREIPDYMWLDDYERVLDKFSEYAKGS